MGFKQKEKKKNQFISKIAHGFRRVLSFPFLFLSYILNNTIGYLFVRKHQPYGKTNKNARWMLFRRIIIILFILFLVFAFDWIYDHTIYHFVMLIFRLFSQGTGIYSLILKNYGHQFAQGIKVTLSLSLVGTVVGLILATLFSFLVTQKVEKRDIFIIKALKQLGIYFIKTYVTIIRGTPMMVQAMIIFWGVYGFMQWDYQIAGLVVVSINTSAYLTEVLRGSIMSLDYGQTEAAQALGLSKWQTMIHVVYPQAIKNAMASIGNEFVVNIKDTSVLSVIMVVDIFRVATIAQGRYSQAFPPFIIAAIIYLVITYLITSLLRYAEKKLGIPTKALPSTN